MFQDSVTSTTRLSPSTVPPSTEDTPGAMALAWLSQNFIEQLVVEALAERFGMSVSSLYRHFAAVLGMTPIQYQRRLRLLEARRLMFVERLDLASARSRVGYRCPRHFVRDYRRLYGVTPERDANSMRGTTRFAYCVCPRTAGHR